MNQSLIRLFALCSINFTNTTNVLTANMRVGMSSALTGPLSEVGLSMQVGIYTYFSIVNKQGGIQGKPHELLALDDAYESSKAAAKMRQFEWYAFEHSQ